MQEHGKGVSGGGAPGRGVYRWCPGYGQFSPRYGWSPEGEAVSGSMDSPGGERVERWKPGKGPQRGESIEGYPGKESSPLDTEGESRKSWKGNTGIRGYPGRGPIDGNPGTDSSPLDTVRELG